MTPRRTFLIFSSLYILSFLVLMSWFVLLFIGFFRSDAMALANRIALPTLFASILSLEVFRRLARRAEKNLKQSPK